MTYYRDLSGYEYFPEYDRPGTKNIGWLEHGHEFDIMVPSEEILELLWRFCAVSVVQTRGLHDCDLCTPCARVSARKDGLLCLLLGSAEIRVFSRAGEIFAAPNLIYHYVNTHHYKPPDEFLRALREGPNPPSAEYFEQLKKLNLEWDETSTYDPNAKSFRFVRDAEGNVHNQEVHVHMHHD